MDEFQELRERCVLMVLGFLGDVNNCMAANERSPWIPQEGWVVDCADEYYNYILDGEND